MPRATWTGAISFGLVNVPVKLFTATQGKQVRFHQFERESGQRIRLRRVAEESGHEVAYEDIVKGFEVSKGRYVMVTPDELAAVEPGQTKTIDIEEFIDLESIDPVYFDKTYYVGPAESAGADRAYALLRDAMLSTGQIAIGRFVMRTKQYLTAIRPRQRLLVLETMFFPDEIRDVDEIEGIPEPAEAKPRELEMAARLIDSLARPWDAARHRDEYRDRVLELIERKDRGEEVVTDRAPEPASNVVDLMAALQASVDAAKGGRSRRGSDELDQWTKSRLYEEAARRDIAGRSSMSKAELAAALREAS